MRDTGGEAGGRQTRKGFEELLGGQVALTVLGRQMETKVEDASGGRRDSMVRLLQKINLAW